MGVALTLMGLGVVRDSTYPQDAKEAYTAVDAA